MADAIPEPGFCPDPVEMEAAPFGAAVSGTLTVQAGLMAPEFPARVPRLTPRHASVAWRGVIAAVRPSDAAPVAAPFTWFPPVSPLKRLGTVRLETVDPPLWTWTQEPGNGYVTEPATLAPRPLNLRPVTAKVNGSSMGTWAPKPVLASGPSSMEAPVHLAGTFGATPPAAARGSVRGERPEAAPLAASRAVLPRFGGDTAQPVADAIPEMAKRPVPFEFAASAADAVAARTRLAARSGAVEFALGPVRRPHLGIADDRLSLRFSDPLREELAGADMIESAAAAQQQVSSLASGNVLPALASLFRYSRSSRPEPPMSPLVEGMSPQDRRPTRAAFRELPMGTGGVVIPRASGLRIVETFEYLRPMEKPPFDLWAALVSFWGRSPVYVRFAAAAACLMLLLWSAMPAVGLLDVVAARMDVVRDGIGRRAAVELAEDFQGGMTDWSGAGDWESSWRISKAGYVKPGRLALYRPSMHMREYNVDFLMQIDQKALGFAYRAKDENNYYAAKISIQKPGPLPIMSLVRYPVIGGQQGKPVEVPIRMVAHNDTPYRVRLTVSDRGYSTSIEGQLVDFWSDERLTSGGFGFFTDAGESARVYWMKLAHQTDVIGRVCAYFYTADIDRRNTRRPQ